jgi:hypothetical protein
VLLRSYFDWVVESLLEPLEDGWDDEDELGDEELSLLEPAPAEPLGEELELDGELLDEEPPLASFFASSDEDEDEELEPGVELLDGELVVPEAELDDGELGAGAAVVPEAELEDEPGVVVEPEPEGVVALEEEAPAGARAPVSDLLQPAIIAPPNARETARARVENFMGPPWLGYGKRGSKDRAGNVTQPPCCRSFRLLRRRRGIRALRPGLVAALLEVAMLRGRLRIDLSLLRVRAFALLRRCRSSSFGRTGRGARRGGRQRRSAVGLG